MGMVRNPFGIQSPRVFSIARTVSALLRANTYLHYIQHLSLFVTFETPNIFTLDTEKIIIGQTYTSKTPDSSPEGLTACLPTALNPSRCH